MAEEVLKVTRHPNYAVLTLNRPKSATLSISR